MVDKKLFTFKHEKSEGLSPIPKTPIKKAPYKDCRESSLSMSPSLHKIATGDFFEVYVRKDRLCLLDNSCTAIRRTIKMVRSPGEREEVLGEVEKLKKIKSPYVIKHISNWEVDYHIFIEVEFCNLGTLRDLMNYVYYSKKSSFTKALTLKIMREVLLGLKEVHRLRVVHLDLKPENIFLRSVGSQSLCEGACGCERPIEGDHFTLKIGDFNISRYEDEEIGMDGDKRYMAPEVLDGVCKRSSDVFSLGLIYLEILNGIILPSSGEGWRRLRENDFEGIHLPGPSRGMVERDYRERLDVEALLPYFK